MPARHLQQRLPDLDLERRADQVQPRLAAPPKAARRPRPPAAPAPRRTPPSASARAGRPSPPRARSRRRRRGRRARGRCPWPAPGRRACRTSPRRSSSPSPPRAYSPGLIASQRRKRSCSRPDPDSPAGIGGVEHAVPLGEQPLGVVERQVLLVALRADADPLAEHALEMRRAQADARRDLLERRLLAARARRCGRWRGRSPRSGRARSRAWRPRRILACPESSRTARAPHHPNPADTRLRRRARAMPSGAPCPAQLDYATISEIFRRFHAAEPEPKGELAHTQRLHAARRRRALGAGDRQGRQPRDRGALPRRRHARRRCSRSARRG